MNYHCDAMKLRVVTILAVSQHIMNLCSGFQGLTLPILIVKSSAGTLFRYQGGTGGLMYFLGGWG
jgi:hypothetical protein